MKEPYKCYLSDRVGMPKVLPHGRVVGVGATGTGGGTVTFQLGTSEDGIAPYNRYYQGSQISFYHVHDALPHTRADGVHFYHSYYTHTYVMPILSQTVKRDAHGRSVCTIRTKTTTMSYLVPK